MRLLLSLVIFLALCALFIPVGLSRLIAGDEGFYLMGAKLLLQGSLPYRDFFFPQMPGAAAFPALSFLVGDSTWHSARVGSALTSALLGTLIFSFVWQRISMFWALFATLCYAGSEFTLAWFTTTKPYASSALFLFMTFSLLTKGEEESVAEKKPKSVLPYILAGVSFAFAVQLRLYTAVLVVLFAPQAWRGAKGRALGYFIFGMAIAFLPSLYLFAIAPEHFLFNNIGFHLTRSDYTEELSTNRKLLVLAQSFGLAQGERFGSLQFPLLLVGTLLISLLSARSAPTYARGSIYVALLIFVVSFLPTPMYAQYLCLCVPFLALSLCAGLSSLTQRFPKGLIWMAVLLFCIAYLNTVPASIERYSESGEGVIGIRSSEQEELFNLEHIEQVAALINQHTIPGEQVFAEWSGYLVDTHAKPYLGLEGHFGFQAAKRLDPELQQLYKVLPRDSLLGLVQQLRPKVVIGSRGARSKAYERQLPQLGYAELAEIGETRLYGLK